MVERDDTAWVDRLGDAASEVFSDLESEAERERARQAFRVLAEALGEDEASPAPDPGLPGEYTVLGVLGRGASGVVYRALQESLGREVAVKVMHPGGDARDTERLLGEARRLAALSHPGIVAVHEVGRAATGVYMTLELQAGGSLQSLIAQGALNPARAARLTRQAADALVYTHARGVVHLDLKPGNVLLSGDGDARIADFGLARDVTGTELTASSGGLLGTPAFMAPEQAADRRDLIGERTDVYGLGVLLYACLAGAPPFNERTLLETLRAVQQEEPRPLERIAPGAPRDLIAITCKAMAKAPGDRYATARELSLDLARFEKGETVSARLPNLLQRLMRSMRRNVREIGIAVAASLLGLVTVLPFLDREQEDRSEGWVEAADELLDAGETRAAALLLSRIARRPGMTEQQVQRLASLQRRARSHTGEDSPEAATGGSPPSRDSLGLSEIDRTWLRSVLGEDWLSAPLSWLETPLDVERAWKRMLSGLAREWASFPDADRARALRIASAAPMWQWQDGFSGWLSHAPVDARQLLEAAADAPVPGDGTATFGILVDIFAISDQGAVARIGSRAGSVAPGESLRFEGRGESGFDMPHESIGLDFLRLSPPGSGALRRGEVRYEVEGTVRRLAGGSIWDVRDLETYLGISGATGGWFLDSFTHGLPIGHAAVLDAHRYLWGGDRAVTIVMLGEAIELDAGSDVHAWSPESRDLSDWQWRFAQSVQAELQLGFDAAAWERVPPLLQGGFLGDVLGAAALRPAADPPALEQLQERLEDASIEAGSLSDAFCGRGTHAGVTSAGADCAFWLDQARRSSAGPAHSLGAALDDLPLPSSASSRSGPRPDRKTWFFTLYIVTAIALLIAAILAVAGSPRRRSFLGWSLIIAAQGIDKTAPLALGAFPWDPLALTVMALAAHLLSPYAGGWARAATICLGVAALQELGLSLGHGPEARLPIALAFPCLAGAAARIAPSKILKPLPLVAAILFVPAGLVTLMPLESAGISRVLYAATLAGGVFILLVLAVVGSIHEGRLWHAHLAR